MQTLADLHLNVLSNCVCVFVCVCVCVCVWERESEHMHLFWDPRSAAFQAMVLGERIELGEVPVFQFCFEFPATQILSVSYHIYNSIDH